MTPSPTPEPAHVVASYPIDEDLDLAVRDDLVLVFDRPMEEASLRAAWYISPTITGTLVLSGSTQMRFVPASPWSEDVVYEVTLDEKARSVAGGPLDEPFSLRFGLGGRGSPIPVLMYHRLEELDQDASEGMRTWTVSPQAFEEQLRYLYQNGWHSIGPQDLAGYLLRGEPLPPRPVMISMDDGYAEVYSVALPLCQQFSLRPTLFIVPVYLGCGDYVDWSELEELVDAGFWIGSHSWDHSSLRGMEEDLVRRQLLDSQQTLEEELGVRVDAFCYPYGSYDEQLLTLLPECGYELGFTLNPLLWQDRERPYRLNRLRVSYDMTLPEFAKLLP